MEGIQYRKGISKQTWLSHSYFQHSLTTNTRARGLKCDSVKDTSLNCEITMVQDPYFLDILPDLQMETLEGQMIIWFSLKYQESQPHLDKNQMAFSPRWNFLRSAGHVDHSGGYRGPSGSCHGVWRWECPENVRDVLGEVQLCNQWESWDGPEKPIPLAEGWMALSVRKSGKEA